MNLKTEISEVVTGLGASGAATLEDALHARPGALMNVNDSVWIRICDAHAAGAEAGLFDAAWANGRALFESDEGLRRRVPMRIEWKGPHKPPGYESLPADLRMDHVYLVSCKYDSKILRNAAPAQVFDHRLVDRSVARSEDDWFATVAEEAQEWFLGAVRAYLRQPETISCRVHVLSDHARRVIRARCARNWPDALIDAWREFSSVVSTETALRWRTALSSKSRKEEMLWRLLRLESSPYFVLGTRNDEAVRYRVATPWDWRQEFRFVSLEIIADQDAGQPLVQWRAEVEEIATGGSRFVEGCVEIRWTHGRFSGVEAKILLVTPPHDVPGYVAL
jgi:hypothetical protein